MILVLNYIIFQSRVHFFAHPPFFFGATCQLGPVASWSSCALRPGRQCQNLEDCLRLGNFMQPVVCFARVTKEILSWRLIICRPLFSCKAFDQVSLCGRFLHHFGMDKKNNFTTSELNDFSSVAWLYRLYSPLPPPTMPYFTHFNGATSLGETSRHKIRATDVSTGNSTFNKLSWSWDKSHLQTFGIWKPCKP